MVHKPDMIVLYILGAIFFVVFVVALIAAALATDKSNPLQEVHKQIANQFTFATFVVGLLLFALLCINVYLDT